MQWLGLGLFLHCFGGEQWQVFTRLQSWQRGFLRLLFRLATHGTPTGGLDDRTLESEYLTACGQGNFGHFLDATWQEGFEQACGNHFVDSLLVLRQTFGQVLGDEKRMVVGDFGIIYRTAVERCVRQDGCGGGEAWILPQEHYARGDLVENILGYITAAGTWIA